MAPCAPATPRSVASLLRVFMANNNGNYEAHTDPGGPDAFCRCRDYGNEVETIVVESERSLSPLPLAFRMFLLPLFPRETDGRLDKEFDENDGKQSGRSRIQRPSGSRQIFLFLFHGSFA